MSTDDVPVATTQARRRLVPVDPSEDELARHWSLTPADLAVVAECRGHAIRRVLDSRYAERTVNGWRLRIRQGWLGSV